jgi:hypothetical protein
MPLDQIVTHIKPQGINSICKEYILQMFIFEKYNEGGPQPYT